MREGESNSNSRVMSWLLGSRILISKKVEKKFRIALLWSILNYTKCIIYLIRSKSEVSDLLTETLAPGPTSLVWFMDWRPACYLLENRNRGWHCPKGTIKIIGFSSQLAICSFRSCPTYSKSLNSSRFPGSKGVLTCQQKKILVLAPIKFIMRLL